MRARTSWMVPVASAFALSAMLTLSAFLFGPGCQTRCFNNFDCGPGSYCSALGRCETECFTDLDCRSPPECAENPTVCEPRGFRCDATGRCQGRLTRATGNREQEGGPEPIGDRVDGFDLPPASGLAFIVSQIAIAGRDRGFDIDGNCDPTTKAGCIDNILYSLGDLGNDQIRQGLLGGESLLLIELAGLDEPYHGDDSSVTVKIYGARDADRPFFPANNFKTPPGRTTCCEFEINPQSLFGTPNQARARAAARIERGLLTSIAPVPIQFTLTVGQPPHPEIRLENVIISGRVPSNKSGFNEGLLGGAVPINTLAQTENPYCKTVSPRCPRPYTDSTLVDLVATLLRPQPDIDLDIPPDGLECVLDVSGDGRIDRCCDGNGLGACTDANRNCIKAEVPPVEPDKPWTCTNSPKLLDGYSVAITFTAVAASIVGVSQ